MVDGKASQPVAAELEVEVTAAVLEQVLVHAEATTVAKGLSVQLTAEGRWSDGFAATIASPAWTSSSPAVVAVDGAGLAFGAGVGTAQVTATQGPASGSLAIEVTPPLLVSAVVQPSAATTWRGHRVAFSALGTYTDGSTADATQQVGWAVSDAQLAAVDAPGKIRGVAGGTVQVTASWAGGAAQPASLQVSPQRLAFETSTVGPGNMSSWPASGGLYGLVGADAVCQSLAGAAGLPGTFRAWLSDSHDDAWCRVQNLSGKKSALCGQQDPPVGGGPWIRTDGQPFAASLEALVSGQLYTPLSYDETGRQLSPGLLRFTATDPDGAHSAITSNPYWSGTCGDWVVSSGAIQLGGVDDTADRWTRYGGTDCSIRSSLACLEVAPGAGAPLELPAPPAGTKLVFVTSMEGTGNLRGWPTSGGATGLAAGDAICQALASLGGLPNAGRFKAFLSDSTVDAIDRLSSDGPWARPDGILVAENKARIASGRLLTAIEVTERLGHVGFAGAWTGSTVASRRASATCNDWKDDASYPGVVGLAPSSWNDWLAQVSGASACWGIASLYCFED